MKRQKSSSDGTKIDVVVRALERQSGCIFENEYIYNDYVQSRLFLKKIIFYKQLIIWLNKNIKKIDIYKNNLTF